MHGMVDQLLLAYSFNLFVFNYYFEYLKHLKQVQDLDPLSFIF